jgi:hypothetical protein
MRRILGVSVDHAENTHVALAVTPFVPGVPQASGPGQGTHPMHLPVPSDGIDRRAVTSTAEFVLIATRFLPPDMIGVLDP